MLTVLQLLLAAGSVCPSSNEAHAFTVTVPLEMVGVTMIAALVLFP